MLAASVPLKKQDIEISPEMVRVVKDAVFANHFGDGDVSFLGIDQVLEEALRDALLIWISNHARA